MSTNSSTNGRTRKEKARIVYIANHLRQKYRDYITLRPIPIITGSPTPEQIAQGIESSSALIPNNSITTILLADKTITGINIAQDALDNTTILRNPSLSNYLPNSPNLVSNLDYAKREITTSIQQLDIPNAIANLGNIFEGKLDFVESSLPIIDASLQIIDTIFWATETRFANESITQTQLTLNPILSTNATITNISTSPSCPTNTQYVRSLINPIVDSSPFTIKEIAQAVSDLSYNYVVSTLPLLKPDAAEFGPSANSIIETQLIHDISLAIPLQYPFESTYTDYATYMDASLNLLQSQYSVLDSSFSGIISNAIITFDTAISSIYSTDNSFALLETKWDNSYNEFAAPNWVKNESIAENIELPITTLGTTFLFDNSSNSPATTEYVKLVLAGSLANDPELLEALFWIRNAIANDASFAYNIMREIGELNAQVSQNLDTIDTIEYGNILPAKIETLREIQLHRNSADSSLASVILPVFDASIQYLESHNPIESVNYNLTAIDWNRKDLSLNLIQQKFDSSYQNLDEKYTQIDGSASTFASFIDQSILFVEQKIQTVDLSINYTAGLVATSQINYDGLKIKTDTSLGDITALCDSMDASNAAVVAGIQTINNLGQQIDNDMVATYTYIKESSITRDGSLALIDNDPRYGVLDMSMNSIFQYASTMNNDTRQYLNTRMAYQQTTDLSLNQCEISVKSRETAFSNLPVDASAAETMLKYKLSDQSYSDVNTNIRRQLDMSINDVDQFMATFNRPLLEQQWSTMQGLDNRHYGRLDEKCLAADSSLAIYFTTTPLIPPLTVLDGSVNTELRNTELHDASFSVVESAEFITNSRLYSVIELPANVAVSSEPSGNTTVSNTQYYWNYLREKIQGNSTISIGEFSESIGNFNIGNYVNQNVNTIFEDLSGQNARLNGISSVNLQDFNVDASLILLDTTYTSKEYDVNQLDWFYGWKTATDASVSLLRQKFTVMESSLNFTLNFFDTSVPQKTQLYTSIDSSYASFVNNLQTQSNEFIEWSNTKKNEINDLYIFRDIIKDNISYYTNEIEFNTANVYASGVGIVSGYENLEANSNMRIETLENAALNFDSSYIEVGQTIPVYLKSRLDSLDNTTLWNNLITYDNSLVILDPSLIEIDNFFTSEYETRDIGSALAVLEYDLSLNYTPFDLSYQPIKINAIQEKYNLLESETFIDENNIQDISLSWIADSINLNSNIELPSSTTTEDIMGVLPDGPVTANYLYGELSMLKNANIALDTLSEFASALDNDPSLNFTIIDGLDYIDNLLQLKDEEYSVGIENLDASMAYYIEDISGIPTTYSDLNDIIVNNFERMSLKDASINSLETQYNGFFQTLNTIGGNLATNDSSTNFVSNKFTNNESKLGTIDSSFTLHRNSATFIETIFITDTSLSSSIANSLTTNDTSTNNLGATTTLPVRDTSVNSIFTLLGTPSGISAQSTNSTITVSYQAPILGSAMNLSKYTILGTPVSGTTTTLSRDVSSNVVSSAFTGLTEGNVYNFVVSAYTDYSVASTSPYMYGTRLNTPSGFAFTSTTINSIGLQVDSPLLPFDNYNVYYKALTSGSTTNIISSSNVISLTGLETGRIYDVSVNIQNTYGPSSWTGGRNSTRLNLPYTLSMANITTNQATVNISPALVEQDCSYALRTNPNVNQYVLPVGITTQTLTGLAANTNYTIYLDASNIYTSESINTVFTTMPLLNTVSLISLFDACYNVVRTSNEVSNWRDRTVNAYDASQTATAKQPDYNSNFLGTGNPAIDFTGSGNSDGWLLVTNQPTTTTTDITLFIVMKRSSSATRTNTNMSILSSIGTWQTGSIHLYYKRVSNNLSISINSPSIDNVSSDSIVAGSSYVIVVNITSTGGCISSFRLNGTASSSTLTHSSSAVDLRGFFEIGGWSVDTGRTMDGGISEIIQYNRSLYTSEMQMQEARLAWKWGLNGSLPSGHPYKNSQPNSLIPTYYYNFETFSGTSLANMATGTAIYDATIVNASTSTSVKKYGSYSLVSTMTGSSTQRMLTMPQMNFVNLSQFSICVWVYFSSQIKNNPRWIFSYRNGTSHIYSCLVDGTSATYLTVYSNNKTNNARILRVYSSGTWYHIALVQSGSTLKIYENGTLITTTTLVVENSTSLVSTNSWLGSGGDTTTFDGYIDDYRFYSYALTDAEVLQLSL